MLLGVGGWLHGVGGWLHAHRAWWGGLQWLLLCGEVCEAETEGWQLQTAGLVTCCSWLCPAGHWLSPTEGAQQASELGL